MSTGLLDLPVVTAADVAALEDRVADLLGGPAALLLQGEAVLGLEAVAAGLGRRGTRALNVVTGPYGQIFGRWLARSGAVVTDLRVPFDRVLDPADLEARLRGGGFELVAVVHAEAATGGSNDLDAVSALTREHGCLLVVDAVASVGAEPVPVGRWGADAVVIGPQKGLAGPAGVSAVTLSERAWAAIAANPDAPRDSVLSLLDLRERWVLPGRSVLTGTPASLETAAFAQALHRVAAEGLDAVIARHRAAAAATRAGLRAAGVPLWIGEDSRAAPVATTLELPAGSDATAVLASARAAGAGLLSVAAVGTPGVLRVVHAGQAARPEPVLRTLRGLLGALGRGPDDALAAAGAAWHSAGGPPA